ncbi:hypothetical protein [Pannonibacter phragmitetus]|uniref:hypothetical protein n=1 Tax=Pannonibacter phragmitetus TaxID=121719 RepID=UPI0012FD2B88|nr:hypothetical protein [Pannonibacter phragmitetus]
MAEDIAKEGTNPMDLLGVVKRSGTGKTDSYIAAEGNRRVCALMLLHDPEKIPTGVVGRVKMIQRLEAAARPAHISPKINVVLFKSKKSAKPWVDRMHLRDGRSRRQWSADQQERAMGGGRNRDAAALLDAALAEGLITEEDRVSKLTTVQRYIGNPTMRVAFGIVRDSLGDYWVNREINEFAVLSKVFFDDMRQGRLSSRSDAAAVIRYSDQLLERTGVSNDRVAPISLKSAFDEIANSTKENSAGDQKAPEDDTPESGRARDHAESNKKDDVKDRSEEEHFDIKPRLTIGGTPELETAFAKSGSQKLQSLYISCTTLSLRNHCPIVTVGFWSLMESLAALHGGDGSTFDGYFGQSRMETDFGFTNKEQRKNFSAALKRLTEKGNSTKHSSIAASFDGKQLANDFDVLTPFMIAVLRSIQNGAEE